MSLADPFRPTTHLLPLMGLRAAQLYAPRRTRTTLDIFNHLFANARTMTR
jgi:hypothetical protein